MALLRTRVLTIAVAGAAAAFSAAGCGAEDKAKDAASDAKSALDPVAQAADVTSAQKGGVGFAMTGTVDSNGTRVPIAGTGTVDRGGKHGAMTVTTSAGGQDIKIDEIIAGHVIYMRSKLFEKELPGGKSWLKIDLDKAAAHEGLDLKSLGTDGPSQDPAQLLDYLRGAGKSTKLSTEEVRGVKTTRYHVDVDPQKALAKTASPDAKAALKKVFSTLRSKTIPVDVYVDDKHLVRREHMGFAVTEKGQSASMEFTIDYTGFDVPVKADPPADGDTVDALKLLSAAGAGGSSS
jgi:hypothetical protein